MKKLLVSLLIGCVTLGVGCGEAEVSKDKYDELLKKYEDTVCQLEQFKTDNGILEDGNEKLSKKVDTAKDYLELDPTEKELVDAKIVEVNQATEDQLAQEKAQKEAEEKAKKAEEEAKANNHIGETIGFTTSDWGGTVGDWNLTIDDVYITDDRNRFEDPINQVVIIEYTVENVSIPDDDFYVNLELDAEFYNSDGFKCESYPGGDSVFDLAKGMKAKGTAYIGINNDTPYLEMHFGGVTYKWNF